MKLFAFAVTIASMSLASAIKIQNAAYHFDEAAPEAVAESTEETSSAEETSGAESEP